MPHRPIKVVTADDSAVVRTMLDEIFSDTKDIEVVASVADGLEAVKAIEQKSPDVLVLDIEMPKLDGLEVLKKLQAQKIPTKVIVLSTLTSQFAPIAIKALTLGAVTYIQKPTTRGEKKTIEEVGEELTSKIRSIAGKQVDAVPQEKVSKKTLKEVQSISLDAVPMEMVKNRRYRLITIGSSTGGPNALSEIVSNLNDSFSIPIIIVQHMPQIFIPQLAKRLQKDANRKVIVAEDGMALENDTIYISPGDIHTTVTGDDTKLTFSMLDTAKEAFCKPSANPLFRSAADIADNDVLGIVLTGMGEDGYEGAKYMVTRNLPVVVQDEKSSVIWGMPGLVSDAGMASEELSLEGLTVLLNSLKQEE